MRKLHSLKLLLSALLLAIGCNVWGETTVLFHESFGDNSGSARTWSDTYSVKSGESTVYGGITSYSVTNVKQGKNTTGSVKSGLNQSSQGTDAVLIIGPLNLSNCSDITLTYQWKAASVSKSYSTSAYYATSATGTYTEMSGTGKGATTFVTRSYSVPTAAQVSTMYLKIVWNTSNTQAIIDEVDLSGEITKVTRTLDAITLSGQKTSFYVGDAFSFGGTVTASYQETSVDDEDVTSKATFSGYDMNTIGTQTVTASYTEGEITKTQTYSIVVSPLPTYTLTITQPAAGGALTVKNGETTLENGATVEVGTNLTCEVTNIPEGKRFSRFYAKWGEEDDQSKYKATNPATFDNIATEDITACEIYVTYQDLGKFTINYMVNGVNTNPQENVWENTALVFPTVDDIAGKVFRGWIADDPIEGTTDVEPTWVTTAGLTAKANKTYYAVFATETGTPSTDYTKITSMADLTDNDYVVAYDYNGGTQIAMGNTANGTDKINASAISLTGGKYANPDADYIWSIEKVMDGENTYYTLYNADAEKYAKANSTVASLEDEAYNFTITWDATNNCFRIQSSTISTYYLHGYVSGTSYDFRSSTAGNGPKYHLHLYKNESTVAYSDYCTTVAYTRSVTDGNYGTICLPYAVAAGDYEGAIFCNLVDKTMSEDVMTSMTLEEEEGDLVAGKPYIFKATAEEIVLKYHDNTKATEVVAANGLIGNLGEATTIAVNAGNYVVSGTKFYLVDSEVTCGTNRAYINAAEITPAPVQGRRFVIGEIEDTNIVTAIENAEAAQEATKMFINGQFFIIREGNTYDMVGNLVK